MSVVKCKLTVFFESPFWVGVFESVTDGELKVAKLTFGSEPGNQEIYEFILKYYGRLQFSTAFKVKVPAKKKNPKRLLKEAKKQMNDRGIGTKAQQVLKQYHEQQKRESKQQIKKKKQLLEKRQFDLKQQKKKEKHKGHEFLMPLF